MIVDVDSIVIVLGIVVVTVVAEMVEDFVTLKVVVACTVLVLVTVTVTGGFKKQSQACIALSS